jgi:hypothetical protein
MKTIKTFQLFHMNSQMFRSLALAAGVALAIGQDLIASDLKGLGFSTPEDAVTALQQALSAKDRDRLQAIFGPDLQDLVNPDSIQAANEFAMAATAINESHRLVNAGDGRMTLEYGNEKNSFPVPIVKKDGKWFFDTAAGQEELFNRRIGRNELDVLEIIRTYVQAQREYASADRDEDEVLEYAQKFGSAPGKRDGLYWPRNLDGTTSPLGPLVAEAETAGYTRKQGDERRPFHGYYFRILTRQGKHAPGGGYDYVINGNMIGGFALVAWPAEYDETGIMTFIVNQQGRVYQKDMGENTGKIATKMNSYDPDSSWHLSAD